MSDQNQPSEQQLAQLTLFFKIFANVERLKIAGLLANETLNAAQIAGRLSLQPYQVLRHLEQMESLGVVKVVSPADAAAARPAGRSRNEAPALYRLDTAAIEALSKQVLAGSRPTARPEDFEGEAYERKVLSDFMTADGRLKSIPNQEKKRQVILRHLVQAFQPGERYPEKQVNELLRRYHEDTAALRRYLVDGGLLEREQGVYWRL